MRLRLSDIVSLLGKTLLIVLIGVTITIAFSILLLYSTEWLWPEFNGSYNLGDGIYMIEWDGGGKRIVKGSNIKGNTCYGGELLIPSYETAYDSIGNFAEYVVDAKFDNNWIIAKTNNNLSQQVYYYIIDKNKEIEKLDANKIVEKYTFSFTDSIDFANACQCKGISLKWQD